MQNSTTFPIWAALAMASSVFAQAEDEQRSFDVSPGDSFVLNAEWGQVEVQTWDRAAVDVVVERAEKLDLEYDQDNGTLTVRARHRDKAPSGWFGNRGPSPVFRVTVPNRMDLSLATAGGNINVADIEGEIVARTSGGKVVLGKTNGSVKGTTSGGSITVAQASGGVEAATSGGSVRLGSVGGDVVARTSGGSISVKSAQGSVFARTTGGSIELANVDGSIDARTTGGSIHASLSGQPDGDSALHTTGGSITLSLAEEIALDINARTIGGRVTADFPVTTQDSLGKSKLEASVNGGGPKLTLRTTGGSIRLRKLRGELREK